MTQQQAIDAVEAAVTLLSNETDGEPTCPVAQAIGDLSYLRVFLERNGIPWDEE